MKQVRATVSGSFTRHLAEIQHAVAELKARGVEVLSPEQPTIVDAIDGFVFVASDRHRSVRLVQDRHLASILSSDFLWLEASDGYVGPSASLEVGFAIGSRIPVYSKTLPADLTLRQYVNQVADMQAAISAHRDPTTPDDAERPLLVDPVAATETAIRSIDLLQDLLTGRSSRPNGASLQDAVTTERSRVGRALSLPVRLRKVA